MEKNPRFGDAVREACERHKFTSTRHAGYRTGIDYSLISKMQNGTVPGIKVIIRWATAIEEPVNKWLELAGYDPVPTEPSISTSQMPATQQPDVPPAVRQAIQDATTREEKIAVAFEYIRRPELGLQMGSSQMLSLPTESKLALIRLYERMSGVQVLPSEVT